jgi:hypothetical protein
VGLVGGMVSPPHLASIIKLADHAYRSRLQ